MQKSILWTALICSLLNFTFYRLDAQLQTVDSTQLEQEPFLAFYPLLFYFPETSLGFGAATVYNYYPGKVKSSRPSQWQVGGAYTLNKQILLFSFYQYFLHGGKTELFGELGYYDFFFFYYGIGNRTRQVNEESFFVRYPRFRINALHQVVPNLRAGLTYKFDNYNIYERLSNGLLDTNRPTGFSGGIVSALGMIVRYDTRDNINLPTTGYLLTLNLESNSPGLGSDFKYQRLLLDLVRYIHLKKTRVLAFNVYGGRVWGAPPFQELLLYGGPRKGRGVIEGRFRDRHLFMVQTEYRFPLYRRFRATIFASTGRVADRANRLWSGNYHFNYGLGFRYILNPKLGIQLRGDLGLGSERLGYYFTVGEAF